MPGRVSAQLGGALGKLVGFALALLRQLVEEQMQRIEVDTLHVPVRLLGLAVEIGGVGQLLVEQRDHLDAGRGGDIDRGLERPVERPTAIALAFIRRTLPFSLAMMRLPFRVRIAASGNGCAPPVSHRPCDA